jgi:hypothetical protein
MPVHWDGSFSTYGAYTMGLFGIGLGFLALRGGGRKSPQGKGGRVDVDRLLSEIGRGLRLLSAPNRIGGMGLVRQKQYELGRQLAELQRQLRHLEDSARERYEDRAQRVLEQAARYGITLPPP